MPIISATAISPHRIGGKNLRSYWATRNYTERVNHYFGSNIVAHYPLNEESGSVAKAYGETPVATNFIPNPGFEGYATGWTNQGAGSTLSKTTTAGEFHSGTAALKLVAGAAAALVYKFISVIPGKKYNLSFWIRGDGTNAPIYQIVREDYGAYIKAPTNTAITGTDFVQVVVPEFTAPANFYTIRLEFVTATGVAGASFCLDDLVMTQTEAITVDNLQGVYKKATLNQAGFRTGENSVYFDGTTGVGIPLSTLLCNEFPSTDNGTVLIWVKPELDALTDGVVRYSHKFKTCDVSAEANYVDAFKHSNNNKLGFQFKDDDMAEVFQVVDQTTEDWVCLGVTWDTVNVKRYVNGILVGTDAISGTWSKVFDGISMIIGNGYNSVTGAGWKGWLSHCVVGKEALSADAMLYLGQPL